MSRGIDIVRTSDALVVGTGVAGLSVALGAADLDVALVTKTAFGLGGASPMAQGGVAAAVAADDSPVDHAADTLTAAAGLADPEIVEILTGEGPARIAALLELGTRFDRRADGGLALGREAAHRRPRVLHARDATGAEIVRALVEAVRRSPRIAIHEHTTTVDLVVERGRVVGIVALDAAGARVLHLARAVVLATGGIGQVFAHTTNPVEATGDGLAMAARAGAELADLEFVQFHPTALDTGADPMPLLTEALRGRGARLIDEGGARFLTAVHRDAELAPRDVVARAIWRLERAGSRAFLDTREAVGDLLETEFPTAWEHCRAAGLDPLRDAMPVSPAAHYHMGGVAVDDRGRSSLAGLWACGEVTRTGAHGANRLASNSLLEGLVFGHRVGCDLTRAAPELPAAKALVGRVGLERGAPDPKIDEEIRRELRRAMWVDVGLVRDRRSLERATAHLAELEGRMDAAGVETANLLAVARLVTRAALARRESRGAHFRSDYPETRDGWRRPLRLRRRAGGGLEVSGGPSAAPGVASRGPEGGVES